MTEPELSASGPNSDFVSAFLADADDEGYQLSSGDVIDVSIISVYGGSVISGTVEDFISCGCEKHVRVRFRVRMRRQEHCAPFVPPDMLLVTGVHIYKGDAKILESCYEKARNEHDSDETKTRTALFSNVVPNVKVGLGESVREFLVYEREAVHGLPNNIGIAWFDHEDWEDVERLSNSNMSAMWHHFQTRVGAIEGVAVQDGKVPEDLNARLTAGINRVVEHQDELDWHPNTKGVVLDVGLAHIISSPLLPSVLT